MNSNGLSESLWRSAVKWGWSLPHSGPKGFNHPVVTSSVSKYTIFGYCWRDTLNNAKPSHWFQNFPYWFLISYQHVNRAKTFHMEVLQRLVPSSKSSEWQGWCFLSQCHLTALFGKWIIENGYGGSQIQLGDFLLQLLLQMWYIYRSRLTQSLTTDMHIYQLSAFFSVLISRTTINSLFHLEGRGPW